MTHGIPFKGPSYVPVERRVIRLPDSIPDVNPAQVGGIVTHHRDDREDDERAGTVVGYAYASPWKARSAYRYTAECTVYLAPDAIGRGTGRLLYDHVLDELRALGMHVAIGTIALPNAASVALHEACGFRKIAHHSEVGRKFGRWVDIGCWEKRL